MASSLTLSLSIKRDASCCLRISIASWIVTRFVFFLSPKIPPNMSLISILLSSLGLLLNTCSRGMSWCSGISISIWRLFNSPKRSLCRILSLELRCGLGASAETGRVCSSTGVGIRISNIRSSAASSARTLTLFTCSSLTILMAVSSRSRIIDSTSRPT